MRSGRMEIRRSPFLWLAFACGPIVVPASTSGQIELRSVSDWTLSRGMAIGRVDDAVYGLSRVQQVMADSDHVYVLLPQDAKIRVFSRSGEFIREFGGRGRGPGEMTRPSWMGWYESRLWVSDFDQARFTLFDVATGDVETIPYRVNLPSTYYFPVLVPRAMLSNGRFVGYPTVSARFTSGGFVSARPVIASNTDGSRPDTLALLSIAGRNVEVTAGMPSGGSMHVMSPLPDVDLMGFAPDGSSAVIVRRRAWSGSGPAEFDVMRIDVAGDTLVRRTVDYEPRRIPRGFFNDDIERLTDLPGVVDRRALAGALREFYERRRYFPPVTDLTVGNDETIWLAGVDEDGEREWLVLDASGESIGRFLLPATSRVSYANRTEAWVVEKDALDIPYVVRYDIVP